MARYPKDINAVYISERMQENLRHIQEHTVTTVVAPMGYGKSTAALWYLEDRQKKGHQVFRVNIYSPDVNLFWQSFCAALRGTELGRKLEGTEFPVGPTAIHMLLHGITEYLHTLEGSLFLLLDDCHLMEDRRVFDMLYTLCDIPCKNFHLLLLSRSAVFDRGEELHLGKKLFRITAEDMRLNRTELSAYLRRCGIELSEQDFQTLFQRSEGWFSCVYLNLCSYAKTGALLSRGEDIYSMIGDALYSGYTPAQQQFLLEMCIADEFTLAQGEFITQNPGAGELLRSLAGHNAFIRYLPDTDTYRLHHMLRGYAERLFPTLPKARQQQLHFRYGQWHEAQGQYIQAMRFYSQAGAMAQVLHVMVLDRGVQLTSASPEQVLELLSRCSREALLSEPSALLVLMRRMFTCRNIPKMLELKALLLEAADRPGLAEEERGNLLGECDLIMSFLRYNDISAMSQLHRRASALMTRPAISIRKTGSWTFSSPSVLMMYHREPGKLDSEINEMNLCMPHYYQLTDGHGIGAEFTMEAEAMYNRGRLDDAHILLEKAKAVIAGSRQHYILLCCELLSLRLALCGKLPYRQGWYEEKQKEFEALHDPMLFTVLDGCSAYIHALLGQEARIPQWLREGRLAEANLMNPGRPMFEVIYNQVLLQQKKYAAVLGRGDMLLAESRRFPYLLCEIHLHIQLAAASHALNKTPQALEELKLALDQALPDGILMPFAENAGLIAPLLAHFSHLPQVAAIRQLAEAFGLCPGNAPSPLAQLTKRERLIASLYAAGKTRAQIAGELFLSQGTVKNHITSIYDKLGLTGTPKQKLQALAELFR